MNDMGDDLERRWQDLLKGVLEEFHVPENFVQVADTVSSSPPLQRLRSHWPYLSMDRRKRALAALTPFLREAALRSRPYCVRCGQCCLNASPTLHMEDLPLIRERILTPRALFTLRRGEWGYSHLEGRVVPVMEEKIKVKEKTTGGPCCFYDDAQRSCTIYENRPIQCRHQACWAPERLEALWNTTALTRAAVIPDSHPLRGLMQAHGERCTIERLQRALEILESEGPAHSREAFRILQWDLSLRELVTERTDVNPEELNFFFGRPLVNLLPTLGYHVEHTAQAEFILRKIVKR